MFDVYKTVQETRVVDRNVTITEKRAPTDESVRLLKEMEQAARDKIVSSMRVSNTSFEAVLHGWEDHLNCTHHLAAIFKVNGKKATANFSLPAFKATYTLMAEGIREAIAERISEEIYSCFSAETLVGLRF